MSHENVRILREMYRRRTLAEAAELMHPAAEMLQPSALPDTDEYQGREELVRATRLVLEAYKGFRFTAEEVVDLGERVFMRVRLTGRGKTSGIDLDQTAYHLWTFRDGIPGVAKCSSTRTLPNKPPGPGPEASGRRGRGVVIDRQRVDLIRLTPFTLSLPGGAHPVRGDPHDPLPGREQRLLQPPRDVAAVLDRPHPLPIKPARPAHRGQVPRLLGLDLPLAAHPAGPRVDRRQRVRALVRVRPRSRSSTTVPSFG